MGRLFCLPAQSVRSFKAEDMYPCLAFDQIKLSNVSSFITPSPTFNTPRVLYIVYAWRFVPFQFTYLVVSISSPDIKIVYFLWISWMPPFSEQLFWGPWFYCLKYLWTSSAFAVFTLSVFSLLRLNIVPICFQVSLEFWQSMSAISFLRYKHFFSVCTFSRNCSFSHVGVFSIEDYQGCGKFVSHASDFRFSFSVPP